MTSFYPSLPSADASNPLYNRDVEMIDQSIKKPVDEFNKSPPFFFFTRYACLGAVIDPEWTQQSPGLHPTKHNDNQWGRLLCFTANSLRTHLLSASKSGH